MNRPFTLGKDEWDIIDLDRITEACDITKRAEIAAVVMEEGAHLIKLYYHINQCQKDLQMFV